MSDTTFTVSTDEIVRQLAEGTATDEAGCLVWLDPSVLVLTEDGPRPAQQASGYLALGEWREDLATTCGSGLCVHPGHITTASAAKDAADLELVQRTSVTLADLYRKAKNKGLLMAAREY